MLFLKALFSKKKAGAMLFGLLVKVLVTWGLDPALAESISEVAVQLVLMYIGGQTVVDVALVMKGLKTE